MIVSIRLHEIGCNNRPDVAAQIQSVDTNWRKAVDCASNIDDESHLSLNWFFWVIAKDVFVPLTARNLPAHADDSCFRYSEILANNKLGISWLWLH